MDETEPPISRRRMLILEVLAISSLIVLPAIGSALFDYNVGPNHTARHDNGTIINLICLRVGLPLLILFVVWTSGDGLKRFGITKWEWSRDLPYTFLAFGTMILTHYGYRWLRGRHGLPHFVPPEEDAWIRLTFIGIYYLVVGFREELFYRGYLIPRLSEITGKTGIGVTISSLLFGMQHLYQGWQPALFSVFHAFFLSALFLVRRSIWPLVIAHGCYDFYQSYVIFR